MFSSGIRLQFLDFTSSVLVAAKNVEVYVEKSKTIESKIIPIMPNPAKEAYQLHKTI